VQGTGAFEAGRGSALTMSDAQRDTPGEVRTRSRLREKSGPAVGQQISTAAAFTIYGRLCTAANASPLTMPQALAELGSEQLRADGLSAAKARALADGPLTGAIDLVPLRTVEDTAAKRLMALRGIGPWSARRGARRE
jgi:DNA-3-methyladenine glycosylase II